MIFVRLYESKEDYLKDFTTDYLLDSTEELSAVSFDDDVLIDRVLEFKVSGNSYDEKKASLRNLAIGFQSSCQGGLSYADIYWTEQFFRTNGKRYGLLEEFERECIC